QTVHVLGGAHPATDGQWDKDLLGGAAHHVVGGLPVAAGGGHVQKGQFVGTVRAVGGGEFDRVAHLTQVREVAALDDPSGVHDQGKGFLQGEGTFVQGGAHDGALHPLVNQSGDGTQVVQAGHPAAGHDGLVGVLAHSTQQLQVGALEHAVLVDVGDHVAGAPLTLQALQGFQQVTALAGPTTCGQGRATHVQTDGDPVTVFGDDLGAPFGVFQCGRTDVDPGA